MLDPIVTAASYLLTPTYWLAVLAAVGLAAMASVVPGVNSFLVMALAIPFVLFEIDDPVVGIVLLATITGVDNTLDSIPAVLYGQPSAATQVTFLEGHQLARQGRAAHTLGAIYAVSALGGLVGAAALTLAIPVVRPLILKFSFGEIAAMGLVGIAMVSILSRGAMGRGIAVACLGMLLGIVGSNPFGSGGSRLTIGPLFGLPLIPVVLGLFALPEMIDLMMARRPVAARGAVVSTKEVFAGAKEGIKRWRMVIRQSLFGVFLGAIPGVGSAVIDWLAYAFGILFTKDKSGFGRGSLEGVLFAESAQNAKEGGQAIPTLALGVPGGPTWVLVLAAMIAFLVPPGPEMLGANAHITILLVITLAIGNLLITGIGLLVTGQLAKLTMIPYPIIGAIIVPIVLLSAYLDTFNWRAVQVVMAMGLVGLAMKRFAWPRPPLLLGFILAPIVEANLQSAISVHGFVGAITRPITVSIAVIAVATAVVFFRATRGIDRALAVEQTAPEPSSAGPVATVTVALRRALTRRTLLRWEHAMPLALVLLGVLFFLDTFGYTGRGVHFPRWVSAAMVLLAAYELGSGLLNRKLPGPLMDLGMVSAGVPGAHRAGVQIAAMLAGFVLLSGVAGIKPAAVALGAAGPALLLYGPSRWLYAAASAAVVWLFVWVIMDNVLFVIWPEPFILQWLAD